MYTKRSWTDEQLREAVKQCATVKGVLKFLNLSGGASNYRRVKARIEELSLKCTIYKKTDRKLFSKPEEILTENSTASISTIKKYAKKAIVYKCSLCDNPGLHQNKPLILQLDHINGNSKDHRKENLRWLCPNCHSQTETFCGRKNITKM